MGILSRWFGKFRSSDFKLSGAPWSNAQDMVEANSSPEFIAELRQHQAERVLIDALCLGRVASGITLDEMSSRTHWNLDDLFDFESQRDGEISLRDLKTYTNALGIVVDIQFRPASDDPASIAAVEGINRAVRGMSE